MDIQEIRKLYEQSPEPIRKRLLERYPDCGSILEMYKWYKKIGEEHIIAQYHGQDKCYGINNRGASRQWHFNNLWTLNKKPQNWMLAEEGDVLEVLREEAIKRQLWDDNVFTTDARGNRMSDVAGDFVQGYFMEGDQLWSTQGIIFHHGKWATKL